MGACDSAVANAVLSMLCSWRNRGGKGKHRMLACNSETNVEGAVSGKGIQNRGNAAVLLAPWFMVGKVPMLHEQVSRGESLLV